MECVVKNPSDGKLIQMSDGLLRAQVKSGTVSETWPARGDTWQKWVTVADIVNNPTIDEPHDASQDHVRGFNWGAFWLTWIWALGNRSFNVTTGVLLAGAVFLPVIGILCGVALMLYSGSTGNERAWANNRWESVDHFKNTQRRWSRIATFLVFAFICIGIGLTALELYSRR